MRIPFKNLFDNNLLSENPFAAMDQFFTDNNFPDLPPVNIAENEKGYSLDFKVPGFSTDDFKVSIHGDVLTVSAETKSQHTEKKDQYTRKEFSQRSFRRSFTLPELVHDDKVDARYENGILKVFLPKKELQAKALAKEIKVN
ncbi:MAG: Hsp20/alpha crystallin family protein [Bacteroidota bacterium]